MSRIESKLIIGSTASDEANERVKGHIRDSGQGTDGTPHYMVFETRVDGKVYYCCHSGGKVEDGEIMLTDVGQAALESMMSLPLNEKATKTLVFQELRIGKTPLLEKVIAAFKRVPEGSSICFFGDLSKELDAHMGKTFNVTGYVTQTELVFAKTAH